jgi:hypothetical protein
MSHITSEVLIADPAVVYQLLLPIETEPLPLDTDKPLDVKVTLARLLQSDLTFKGQKTNHSTHNRPYQE